VAAVQPRCSVSSETDLAERTLAYLETYNQTGKRLKWMYTVKTRPLKPGSR
jgi:hypothetical protein